MMLKDYSVNKKFTDRLNRLLSESGESQTSLANDAGASNSSVCKWLQGRLPHGSILVRIAEHYNVSTDYLLGVIDEPNVSDAEQAVRGFTGLSVAAIEALRAVRDSGNIELQRYINATIESAAKLVNE